MAAAFAVTLLVALVIPARAVPTTTRVSVGPGDPGAELGGDSHSAAISADGRFVAFVTAAQVLDDAPEAPEQEDVYVRDRQTNDTILVSARGDCLGEVEDCNGPASQPSISANGRYVAFTSASADIDVEDPFEFALDDVPGVSQVYVRDLQAGETHLASTSNDGGAGFLDSSHPSISADGSHIAFASAEVEFVGEFPELIVDHVFVHDRSAGETTRISEEPDDCAEVCHAFLPAISGNGRFVAFLQLHPEFGHPRVLRHDLQTEATVVISDRDEETPGPEPNAYDLRPALSHDGDRIAFTSLMTDWIEDDDPEVPNVFWQDRSGGQPLTKLVSVDSDGERVDAFHVAPTISADGRFVAFQSDAEGLVEGDDEFPAELFQVYLRDIEAGVTELISSTPDGFAAFGSSELPAVSGDGRFVAFESDADDLIPEGEDGNEATDVFVHDRGQLEIPQPELDVLPDPVDFGDVNVGEDAEPRTVTVVSSGDAPVSVSSVSLRGPNAADFSVRRTDCPGRTLAAREVCTVEIGFRPGAPGAREGELRVTSSVGERTATLRGTGTEPALAVTPDPADFGAVPLGARIHDRVVTAASVGTGPVDVAGIAIEGANADDFAVAADGCGGRRLPPGSACAVRIAFVPTVLGPRGAKLGMTSSAGDSPHAVTLIGEGTPPELRLSPDPADFGLVPVGEISTAPIVTAINAGQAPVTVLALDLRRGHTGEFAVVGDGCTGVTLAPGAGCPIRLTFTPELFGRRTADLQAFHTAAGGLTTAGLTGGGVEQDEAAVRVTPDVLDFRGQLVGEDSRAGTITVTSVGMLPMQLGAVTLTGEQASAFRVIGDGCTRRLLAPTEACTVDVVFAPTTIGPRLADVLISHTGASSPDHVELRGIGLDPIVEVTPQVTRRGRVVQATGTGFPAGIDITLTWDPGIGRTVVTTDAEGAFETPMLVLRRDRTGPRTLLAETDDFTVTADVLVAPGSQRPPDFSSRS